MNALKNVNQWLKGLLLFSCLLPFASRGPVFAQCSLTGSEYPANTYVQGPQDSSSVAGLTGGGSLVTWEGSGQDGSYNGIDGRKSSFRNKLILNFGPAYGLYQYDQAGGCKQWNTVSPSQMMTVDLNGDGTDEIIAAFSGYGLYTYDSANGWQLINRMIPEGMITYRNGIACNYGSAYGQWLWDCTRGWRQINTVDPNKMIAVDIDGDAEDELIASFVGYGLYYYDVSGVWTQVNTVIPENMIRLNSAIVCDFGAAHGLWYWTQAGGWVQWNTSDPDTLLAVDVDNDGTDELAASFGGHGLYHRNGAGEWPQLNTVVPQNMIRLNNSIACDYGATHGLWVWSLDDNWHQRNAIDPGQMVAVDIDKDGKDELVVCFSGYGLYYLDETEGWQLLHPVVPEDVKPINFYRYRSYVPCTSDHQCGKDQTCDKTECLSCCPYSAGACLDLCCGKCVDRLGGFCGWSSNGPCASDADCMTGGCSGQVCQSTREEPIITTCEWTECYSAKTYGVSCGCVNATCQWR